jgi:hypothetical protein
MLRCILGGEDATYSQFMHKLQITWLCKSVGNFNVLLQITLICDGANFGVSPWTWKHDFLPEFSVFFQTAFATKVLMIACANSP